MIYFDHNATTPLEEEVLEVMLPFYQRFYGNASSLHRLGRLSRSALETAREQVAALVGVVPSQVVFCSGGTEANNMAVCGLARSLEVGAIAFAETEHPSVLEPIKSLSREGWRSVRFAVDHGGIIDAQSVLDMAVCDLRFASLMLANNETGVIQEIESLAGSLRDRGIRVHCDAVQAVGKIAVNFDAMNVDLMSISGHKIGGPKGIGALVMDKTIELEPFIHGGGQEKGLRGGTENVAAIVGFGKACELAQNQRLDCAERLLVLRNRLEKALDKLGVMNIFARESRRLPNTVQFGIAGIDGEMMVMELDRQGIAVSSGSACSSQGGEPSHVLVAMGVDPNTAKAAVRVSLGIQNTEADIEAFIGAMKRIVPERGPMLQA